MNPKDDVGKAAMENHERQTTPGTSEYQAALDNRSKQLDSKSETYAKGRQQNNSDEEDDE